ncbi:hypothetical protein CDIK_1623 [Cucumispora dikerogammari]|nr:hypothetical protein CDIK_1623 [Cucumispora dikerogammari]
MDIMTFHKEMYDIGNTFLINFSTSLFYNICTSSVFIKNIDKENEKKTETNKFDILEIIRGASLNTQATIITYLVSKLISRNVLLNMVMGYAFSYLKFGIWYGIKYGVINGVWGLVYNWAIGTIWGLF